MKKRVHELAKELKVQGIDLDNKELVNELQSLGYDVKSHSSSLEDDQATAAVEKIVAKRKPKAPPAPVKAAGFVVRRRPDGAPLTAAPASGQVASTSHAGASVQPHVPPPVSPTAPEVHAPAANNGSGATAQGPQTPVESHPETQTAPAATATTAVAATAAPAQTAAAHPVTSTTQQAPSSPSTPASHPAQSGTAPQPMAVQPPPRTHQISAAHAPNHPVQVEKRPMTPAQAAQAQAAQSQVRTGPMGSQQVVTAEANQRPTATKAVVVSRPLIPIKRVTPSSTAHKNIPQAPGPRAIGPITELKVVPGDFGGRKEIIDVTKDKNGRKRTKTAVNENLSKQEIMDIARGRTTLPLRGKKKKPTKKGNKTQITVMSADKKVVEVEETISVSDLSQRLGVRAGELIKKLMAMGQMATINQMLDVTTAELLAGEYGWKVEKVGFEEKEFLEEVADKPEEMRSRPPVVTVMGHVDHGKTSLLDAIRTANVAEGEAGGITQHIGAYSVNTPSGPITFLDTPGHEAFSAMRARGAQVTDLVVLVVAADDGVMPQTVEAIKHAREAKVPILVAINKIDKPGANPQQVKNGLMEQQLVPEEYGGDTIMVPVSARNKEGIKELLENIAVQAEVLELKSNPSKPATGAVIEAKLDKGRGPVATVLVQDGTLKLGDAVVSGTVFGKIRAMMNERGDNVEEVPPGYPVEILGLSAAPTAGDDFNVVEDEKVAKEIAEHREEVERKKSMSTMATSKLEDLYAKMEKGEAKELKVVVKADTQGSVEAVANALEKLSTHKVKVQIIHKGVGGINESDLVLLAGAANPMIIGFNVKPEATAAGQASMQGIPIKLYSIIYTAVDEVRSAMENLLEPIRREKPVGRAEVRQLFVVPKQGTIAGVAVVDGKITRNSQLRLMRAGKVAFTGKVKSLRRLKDDVREVASPLECGVGIDGYNDIQAGDIIEAFEIEEIRQSLS
jgi:translation initiation factor IF-2